MTTETRKHTPATADEMLAAGRIVEEFKRVMRRWVKYDSGSQGYGDMDASIRRVIEIALHAHAEAERERCAGAIEDWALTGWPYPSAGLPSESFVALIATIRRGT